MVLSIEEEQTTQTLACKDCFEGLDCRRTWIVLWTPYANLWTRNIDAQLKFETESSDFGGEPWRPLQASPHFGIPGRLTCRSSPSFPYTA